MSGDNRCMYMAHVCFSPLWLCCGCVCCVAAVVNYSVFLALEC